MKQKIGAIGATIALLFTGLLAGIAPAQAAPVPASAVPAVTQDVTPMGYGTYVRYFAQGCSSPGCEIGNWHIRVWTMNGAHNFLWLGDSARNVRDVCPADSAHGISYFRPDGTGPVHKNRGQCQSMLHAQTGTYNFTQWS